MFFFIDLLDLYNEALVEIISIRRVNEKNKKGRIGPTVNST